MGLVYFYLFSCVLRENIRLSLVLVRLASIASSYVRLLLLCNRCRSVNREDINTVLRRCNYGDWFLLMQIAKHIRPTIFYHLMLDLRDKLDKKRASNEDTD